ncbi:MULTISPECIES: DUF4393 domain-containing protein [Paenibacillus]|uniref:DUF4393 domain-containing protein n=1 Tax=Paenibacillus TaxID=44249 RepID=UPI00088B94CC|nr:DUF4393 domain-containing protein [Paenibacillus sp. OK060]SDM13787.1 protein of unknown function [Paenibacillus sp. OK060]
MSEPSLFSEALNSTGDIVKNLPEEVKNDVMRGPAKEIGTGLSNLMYIIFSPFLKSRVKIEHSVKKMKAELEDSISSVPTNKLVEPALNIVGPAIEGSKYHIEDDNVRGLFVKLITSASNVDKVKRVHPSFVEIIKQLSPFDAMCINFLAKNQLLVGCGIIHMSYGGGHGYNETKYLFPFNDINIENMTAYLSSIDNLIRLGLIHFFEEEFIDESMYNSFGVLDDIIVYHKERLLPDYPHSVVTLKRCSWSFTMLGLDFINSCVIDLN